MNDLAINALMPQELVTKIIDDIKIIIVEDNDADADLLLRELKKQKIAFISIVVQTEKDFENALQNFSPDIILSDFSLPSFDAVTAFNIKQKLSPQIPFIIISGIIGEENVVELIKNGVTDYIAKDNLFTLAPKINRALREAEERREKLIIDEKLKTQTAELIVANYELALKNKEKEERASELLMFNKELKETQENLEEYARGLEEMMFITSHKIRVPITNILGIADLLDRPLDSPEKLKISVDFIRSSAKKLDAFTRELSVFMEALDHKGKFKR